MGLLDLFKKKNDEEFSFKVNKLRVNIKSMPKDLERLPKYTGYVISIEPYETKGWYIISMGKKMNKVEKKFYVDEHGLHNVTNIIGDKIIGTKMSVGLGENLSSKGKEHTIIMSWQFV
jgi:hypothetical protein